MWYRLKTDNKIYSASELTGLHLDSMALVKIVGRTPSWCHYNDDMVQRLLNADVGYTFGDDGVIHKEDGGTSNNDAEITDKIDQYDIGLKLYNEKKYVVSLKWFLRSASQEYSPSKDMINYLSKNHLNQLRTVVDLLERYYKDPEIISLGFDEGTTLVKGVHYTLRWNIKHASEVYINGQSVSPSNRAYKVINNDLGFKTFTLLVVNGIKQKSASVNVEVVSGAVIEISSSKNKLRQGKEDKVEISWDISHAKSAILKYDNVERAISLKGKFNIECRATTKFVIDAVNRVGNSHVRKSIEVQVCKECNIVFKADKTFTLPSVLVKLSWKVTGGNDIRLNGEPVGLEGYKEVFPTEDTEYKLSAHDPFGQTSKNITVRMLPIPVMKSILVPTPHIEKSIMIEDHIPRINMHVDLCTLLPTPNLNVDLPALEVTEPNFVQLDDNIKLVDDNIHIGKRLTSAFALIKSKITQKRSYGRK